ncbi:uncharacterized protein LOC130894063 isoform X1 [Diorhabda carinulata]|uniref:uncharacterized protein LOC130894063 isoform X1 n=1 Tax=Diorhabda carinulata TaxID=1163345 RepID=UPI00259FFC1B|nr:uncharacterized protein LOC130894063 isoform X1 [Diorhabda carinulata]XP_057656592.1 uncharacterized protein LOC130894063 isoform X1 [Diorhabda carinulata]
MTLGQLKKKKHLLNSASKTITKYTDSHGKDRFTKLDDPIKEEQRPPVYNPEDYAYWIRKWGKKSVHGIVSLYSHCSMSDLESHSSRRSSFRDYRNPMLSSSGMEMTLRQFGTVSELLSKLKSDLRLAYPSFVQEFVADPLDGVTILLDLLRAIQLSQSNNGQIQNAPKLPPAVQRRTLLDELCCLQCLFNCCIRYSESVRKLTSTSAGLFTLAVCIMSNVNKSRILALQLLSKACEPPTSNHSAVSEAMSTLRLRFGEPVRFRFLVGMLSSAGSHVELLTSGLRFINSFLNTADSVQKRIYLQAELEQAGFDLATIKKNVGVNVDGCEALFKEMDTFEKQFIDVENLTIRTESAEKENDHLKDKLSVLERRIQVLQEEKGILVSMDQCLRDKCSELREEVQSLRSSQTLERRNSVPTAEDEGISSSERTPTPETDIRPTSVVFERYTAPEPQRDNESEEETTIEEVIQELQDIISNEETEVYNRENLKNTEDKSTSIHLDITNEYEIIPSNLQPEPPKKSRSLIHLFFPSVDYECNTKEIYFEAESLTSDSSYSISDRYEKKSPSESNSNRKKSAIFPGHSVEVSYTEIKREETKTKSLDRVDNFESINVVVTNKNPASRSKSDSGNISGTSVCRSISNVYVNNSKDVSPKFESNREEKHKMFLPTYGDEVLYYFPRIQERRYSNSSSFLNRGYNNAGLYSGRTLNTHQYFSRSREIIGSDCRSSGKLTDFPSGLY